MLENHAKTLHDRLDITYTQYITLMVLWEEDGISLNKLGQRLMLDSGTLTPLLKKMEKKQLLSRVRNSKDERQVNIFLTDKGKNLKDEALKIPEEMVCNLSMPIKEIFELRDCLKNMLKTLENAN